METRILIPPSISLVIIPSFKTENSESSKNPEESGKEEPTSSSGLRETKNNSNSDDNSSSNSDEEETDETEKISRSFPSSSSSSSSSEIESDLEIVESESKNDNFIGRSVSARSRGGRGCRDTSVEKKKSVKISSDSYKSKLRSRKSNQKLTANNYSNSGIKLCAKEQIEKGTKFSPNDGEIRILFLDQVSHVSSNDIRFVFGCFDRVTEDPLDDEKEIRLCNWIRFLRGETNSDESISISTQDKKSCLTDDPNIMTKSSGSRTSKKRVNLIARFVDGKPLFEFTERVDPGTELVVFFDIDSITQSSSLSNINTTTTNNDSARSKNHEEYGDDLKFDKFDHTTSKEASIPTQLNHFYAYMKMKNEELVCKPSAGLGDGPLDLSKSPSSVSSHPHSQKFPSSIKIKTETPFESPESQQNFPIIFEPAPKSHLFSIRNVLQLGKIFQPYSLPNNNNTHTSRHNPLQQYQTSSQNLSPPLSSSATSLHLVNSSSLAKTPTSIRSSSSTSGSPMRNPSPGNNSSPVIIRPILRTRGRERSLLPCEVCGKAFDRPSLLKRHMRTHTGEKPHICDVCSKGFSTSSSLNTHRRIHSGEKPHQCPICGKRFTASSNLYYHRMTHNKEKPHKCVLCGKSFPTPGDLKSHQYVHSGSWPYNCPICHRGFSKQTNLRNHLLLHSGDKPHNCHICGKKFALACNLRAHLRTHEEEPVSSCISCSRSFLTSLNMLVNGHCRSCLLTSKPPPSSSSSSDVSRLGSSSCNNPRRSTTNNNAPSQTLLAPLSALPREATTNSLGTLQGFHFPTPGNPGGVGIGIGNLASLFPTGSLNSTTTATPTATNPFLEQLFQWNYRFAKETAGNLSIMQQKLLESQMLAAQLMIGSSNPPNFGMGISDLLRMRPQDFNGVDLNKFIQQ